MIQFIYNKNSRILLLLSICLIFPVQLIYCQTDSLSIKNQAADDKKDYFKQERLSLSLGYFFTGNNTGVTLGSKQAGIGLIVDFEDAFGLKTSSFVFRGNANYSYGKRKQHAIILDYFSVNRKATKTLDADLEFGDTIFPVGTQLDSKYYLSIIRANYEYTFFQDERVSLGFSAGLFIMPISFSVKSGDSNDQTATMIAPLPVIGLKTDFLVTKKLMIKQRAELLYLSIDNFSGGILDLNCSIEHKTFKHFGFGLGINSNRLNISAIGEDYPGVDFFGSVKMDYTGVFLYLSYYL